MMELELESCGSKHPTFKTKHIKKRLQEKFGKERVIFTSVEGRANLIAFKETADRILQEVHDASEKSPADKVTDVIKAAARLIKEEILSFTDEKKTTHFLKRLEMLMSNWHILPVVCRASSQRWLAKRRLL